ncbi:MAG TPA: hypothetical protein VF426_03930 [Marmoricola sp.]
MNTLHDILTDRAEAVTDSAHHERVAAVRRRITVARRRRQAAVAGAAAAVVAIAGIAVSLPHHHDVTPADAPSKVVGHDVPPFVLTTLNATYDYKRSYVGHNGELDVTLPASDIGYLVWMASRNDRGRLVLKQGGERVWGAYAGGFKESGYYQVAPGAKAHLKLSQIAGHPGDVALAVYTFKRPGNDWYVHDGVMFPGDIGGRNLLGAKVGDAGQRSVTVQAAKGARSADFYFYCQGLPHDTYLAVSIKGESGYMSRGTQCDIAKPDPIAAPDNGSISQKVSSSGFEATLQAQDAHGKPVAIPATARIGLGIYPTVKSRSGLPEIVDNGGHLWRLSKVTEGSKGLRALRVTVDGPTPTMVTFGSHAPRTARVRAWVGGDEQVSIGGAGFSSTVIAGSKHTAVREQMTGPAGRGRLFIATYTLEE